MRKTRKLVIQKQKSKRRGRGINEVPFLLKSMLNDVHLRTYGQEFADNGNPSLVSHILQELPRASVTEAIENAPYKKEMTDLISQRLNQSAKSAKANNYVIASKIINTIPATRLTIARQKQELINKKTMAEEELDTYTHYAKSVHDRMKEAHANLGILRREKEKLEAEIEGTKLGKKFYKLETQHKELLSNKSILNRSKASLVSLRLASIRYGILRKEFNKLDALIKEIRKEYQISLVARDEQLEAYRQEHKLVKILGDLESDLEDLRTQERLLNRGQGKRRKRNTHKKRRRN